MAGSKPVSGADVAVPTTPITRPQLRWLIEMHMQSSFPLFLTNDPETTARLSAGPELVSTVDVAPPILPAGQDWYTEIPKDTPQVWLKLDQPAGSTSYTNSGSIGGSAALEAGLTAPMEIDVTSAIKSSLFFAKQFTFNATFDGIPIYTMATVGLDVSLNHTVMFWVRIPLRDIGSGTLLSYETTGGTGTDLVIEVLSTGLLRVTYGTGATGQFSGSLFICDGLWHLVSLVTEVAGGNTVLCTLYVDGVQVGLKLFSMTMVKVNGALKFGTWPATFDDVLWYFGKLTLARIQALYAMAYIHGALEPTQTTWIAAVLNDNPTAWYRLHDDPTAKVLNDVVGDIDPGPMDWKNAVLADAPQVWYRLGETGSPTKFSNAGSLVGAADLTRTTTGDVADVGALAADIDGCRRWAAGGVSNVTLTTSSQLVIWNDVTIEMWLLWPLSGYSAIEVFRLDTNPATNTFMRVMCNASGGLEWRFCDNIHAEFVLLATAAPTVKRWRHHVFTFDNLGATARMTAYIDGVQVAQGTTAFTLPPLTACKIILTGGPTANSVDEVVVYDAKILSLARIQAHFQAGRGGALTMLSQTWGPNGGSSVIGALQGDEDQAWSTPIMTYPVANIDFQSIVSTTACKPFVSGLSVECWVRSTGRPTSSVLVYMYNNAGATEFIGLQFAASGSISILTHSWAGTNISDTLVYDNKWHHIVGTIRLVGGSWLAELYLDGVIKATANTTTTAISGTGGFTRLFITRQAAQITYQLDEIVFYTTPLTAEDVSLHYQAGIWMVQRMYQSRVRTGTRLQFSTPTETGGVLTTQNLSFELMNGDGYWNSWYSKETRGKMIFLHLYDEFTGELSMNLFVGQIVAWSYALDVVEVAVDSISGQKFLSAVPAFPITQAIAPTSQAVGAAAPIGMGVTDLLPGLPVKSRVEFIDPEEYDYLFCRGNFGIAFVYVNGTKSIDRLWWKTIPRQYRVGGQYCTAIRFTPELTETAFVPGSLVSAVGQRSYPDVDDFAQYEWKWTLDFVEDLTGLTATTSSVIPNPLTTANLCTGPSEISLSAVQLNGLPDQYIVTEVAAQAGQVFTVELWLNPGTEGNPTIKDPLISFAWDSSFSSAEVPSWSLYLDAALDAVQFSVRTGSNTEVIDGGIPIDRNVWQYLVFVRTANNILMMFKNGVFVNSVPATSIVYRGGEQYWFWKRPTSFAGGFIGYNGQHGFTRVSTTQRDLRYVQKAYRFMYRNFVELLREIIENDLDDIVDEESFDAACQVVFDIPTANAKQLNCDGYVTQATDARSVIEALSRLRDFRLIRNADGAVAIEIVHPGAVRQMTLTGGMPENNVIQINKLVRFSLSEAIRLLPIAYRQDRDDQGGLKYRFPTFAEILPVGGVGQPMELPFVYTHKTADIIRDFISKRLRLRDDVVNLTANHETRLVRSGHVLHLNMPTLVNYNSDVEVLQSGNSGPENELLLARYDESVFTYEALPKLPVDTTPRDIVLPAKYPIMIANTVGAGVPSSALGTSSPANPAVNGLTGAFTWDILIGDVEELLPTEYTFYGQYFGPPNTDLWTPIGSLDPLECVSTYSDGMSLAASTTPPGNPRVFWCKFPSPAKAFSNIGAVVIKIMGFWTSSGGTLIPSPGDKLTFVMPSFLSAPGGVRADFMPSYTPATTQGSGVLWTMYGVTPYYVGVPVYPVNLEPIGGEYPEMTWDQAVNTMGGVFGYQLTRVDYISKWIYPKIDYHPYLGNVKIWRSGTSPVFPDANTRPYKVCGPQLLGIEDGGFPDTTDIPLPRYYYYFCRVYDALGREIGKYGPVSVYVRKA